MATNQRESAENVIHDNQSEKFCKYLIVRPENGGVMDLLRYMVLGDKESGLRFLDSSEEGVISEEADGNRWVILVSIIVRKILYLFRKPMEYTGYVVDFSLNLLSDNGGFFGLLCNFLRGEVVIPQRGTDTFISTIGHLDGRIDLYKDENLLEQIDDSVPAEKSIKVEMGHRALMDLCVMASKLVYENAKVVQNVVVHHWKMHFVGFYDCWNDFLKKNSTQVFIICDKPEDADLILVSFRGTEPFDADTWSTDIDCSWYEIPKVGKVHMGFLEALGLGNRANTITFQNHLLQKDTNSDRLVGIHDTASSSKGTESVSSNADSDREQNSFDLSSYSDGTTPPDMIKKSAYYSVRKKLRSLLREHKNAEFVVTGHSLGGALAILFPTVLVLHEEMDIMSRLRGVHTFGQPRIGNKQIGKFMEHHLQHPVAKYFRIVYCNDLVPRMPYDDKTFLYKHFGVCLYYNSCYIEQRVNEEPDRNFFGLSHVIPLHLNALWELIRCLLMGYKYGPDYKEGWFSTLFRIMGLALPGVSDHCPTDYVNSVRLGRERVLQMSSL